MHFYDPQGKTKNAFAATSNLLTSQGLCRRQSATSLRPEDNLTSTKKIKLERPNYQSKRRQIQGDCLSQVWKVDEAGMVLGICSPKWWTNRSPVLFYVWLSPSPLHLLLFHALRALILLRMCQNTHSGWWGCISYQVVPVCLQVYTPVPGAAVCDSWYAFRPESLLHGHASGSIKTHMDIKRSQCKLILSKKKKKPYNSMKKKKTDTYDPRSDLLTLMCVVAWNVEIIFNYFFQDFPSIVPHTHVHKKTSCYPS